MWIQFMFKLKTYTISHTDWTELNSALARISENLGVKNTHLGWNGCPILFHPIALLKNMDIRVSKRHPDTHLAKGLELN